MTRAALFIRHKALPGKRDDVRRVWEKHLRPQAAANPAHLAYAYCYDDADPDVVTVFQLYADRADAQAFVQQPWYPAYEAEVAAPRRHLGIPRGDPDLGQGALDRGRPGIGQASRRRGLAVILWHMRISLP